MNRKTTETKHDYKGDNYVNSMLDKVERNNSKSNLGDLETVVNNWDGKRNGIFDAKL